MLTGIVKATRAHYAALQHKPAPDRVAIDYEVVGHTRGTVWVKTEEINHHGKLSHVYGRRQAELTKLTNRLRAMFPEARQISAAYRRTDSALAHMMQNGGTNNV